MGPVHRINVNEINDKCFAKVRGGGCLVTIISEADCGPSCPFYKPEGMSDWIRVGNYLIPPEEYKEYRRGNK